MSDQDMRELIERVVKINDTFKKFDGEAEKYNKIIRKEHKDRV